MSDEIQEHQIEEEAKSISEAADRTADADVLARLWELTKDRLSDEQARQLGFTDRASKYITFSYSTLALSLAILTFSKDLITQVLHSRSDTLIFVFGLTTIAFLWAVSAALICIWRACDVLKVQEYRTWNDEDLSKVHLGGANAQYGYWRYMIKAGWSLLTHNDEVNDRKSVDLTSTQRCFKHGCAATAALVGLITLTHVLWSLNVASKPVICEKDVRFMSNENNNGNSNSNGATNQSPQYPVPTPTPTAGTPTRRDIQPQPRPEPTPEPTRGRPTNDSYDKE